MVASVEPLVSSQRSNNQPLVDRNTIAGRAYVVMDVAGIIANASKLASPDSSLSTPLGYTSSFTLLTGPATLIFAKDRYNTAVKTHDTVSKALAAVQCANASAETLYGITATVSNGIEGLSHSGLIGASKASFIALEALGHTTTAMMGARYLSRLVSGIAGFYRSARLHYLLKSKSDAEAFEYLKSELSINYDQIKEYQKELPTLEDMGRILPEDKEFVLSKGLEERDSLYLYKEIANRRAGKMTSLRSRTSPSTLLALQKGDKSEAVRLARSSSKTSALKGLLFTILSIAGTAATALGEVFTAGTLKYVLYAVGLYISTHWLYIDMEIVKDAAKTNDPGKYDKIIKWMLNFLVIAVSVAATVYTAGLFPILIGAICGLVVLSTNIAIWYKNEYKKPKVEYEPPPQVDYSSLFARDEALPPEHACG